MKKRIAIIIFVFSCIAAIVCPILIFQSIYSDFGKTDKEPSADEIAGAEHHALWKRESYYDDKLGTYIQIASYDDGKTYIAFTMPADSDLIDYSSTGANRPECYWKGDYKIMDLSDQYQHVKVYDSSAYIGSVKTKMQKEQSRTLGRIFAGFISFFVFAFWLCISIILHKKIIKC